jgi:hypothetical protein
MMEIPTSDTVNARYHDHTHCDLEENIISSIINTHSNDLVLYC